MSSKPIPSAQEIVTALRHWRGNISATAEELGLSRKGLYDLVRTHGINLADFRKPDDPLSDLDSLLTAASPPQRELFGGDDLDQIAHRARERPRLQPARLDHDQLVEIQRLRLEIQLRIGVETSNSAILVQFFRSCFPGWSGSIMSSIAREGDPRD